MLYSARSGLVAFFFARLFSLLLSLVRISFFIYTASSQLIGYFVAHLILSVTISAVRWCRFVSLSFVAVLFCVHLSLVLISTLIYIPSLWMLCCLSVRSVYHLGSLPRMFMPLLLVDREVLFTPMRKNTWNPA